MFKRYSYKTISENIRKIVRNYNEIIVYASILFSIIIQFIPDSFSWKDNLLLVCIYTGILSLIFILLDIKVTVDQKSRPISFRNMFDAKEEIFLQFQEMRRNKHLDETLEIHIIGLKLRAISALLHEFLRDVRQNLRTLHDTRFIIYYFDPNALSDLISPSTPPEISERLTNQYNQYKAISLANVHELMRYNDDPFFSAQNIKFECHAYKNFPSFWGFGIDKRIAFIGPFTWDSKNYVFVGPQNPCLKIDKEDETYKAIFESHYNRCLLYSNWSNEQS